MKLGVMQPYLFPYIGYFQLIGAVDAFVFYDDVAYIRQGWINRNRLDLNGEARYFTVPLANVSSFRPIRETMVAAAQYGTFRRKFFATLRESYAKAPFYHEILRLVEDVFVPEAGSIADMARKSVEIVGTYLGLGTRFIPTSAAYGNVHLKKADRLIDICRQENADTYINANSGQNLYDKDDFAKADIKLWFLKSDTIQYQQTHQGCFVSNLSILDVLMNNSPETIHGFFARYELL